MSPKKIFKKFNQNAEVCIKYFDQLLDLKKKSLSEKLIFSLLKQASTTEPSISDANTCLQVSALKKYPEEFADYIPDSTDPPSKRLMKSGIGLRLKKSDDGRPNIPIGYSREEMDPPLVMTWILLRSCKIVHVSTNSCTRDCFFLLGQTSEFNGLLSPIALEVFRLLGKKPDHSSGSGDPLLAGWISCLVWKICLRIPSPGARSV